MVSSSCSTTITVLPKSRRFFKVFSSLWLSRWCRPMEGSSRIYSTPIREEPIWVARRMRWLSPPDRVPEARDRVRYSSPTLRRKPSREWISFKMGAAIIFSRSFSSRAVHKLQRLGDGLVAEGADVDATHRHRQALLGKPLAVALVAGDGAHVGFNLLLHPGGGGLAKAALQVVDDALEGRRCSCRSRTHSPGAA